MQVKGIILILALSMLIASGLACGGGAGPEANAQRDQAVAFYQGAYPISKEMKQVADDWNVFLQEFSQGKVTNQEILQKSQEYATRLEALPQDLSMLYAAPPLRQLKDDMALALNLGIEAFGLYKVGAETYNISYFLEADEKILELNRVMMRIADEWDDGIAYYNIKPSEILP